MGITHGWTSSHSPDGSDVTPTNMNTHIGGAAMTVSPSAPSTPSDGDLWWDTDDTSIPITAGSVTLDARSPNPTAYDDEFNSTPSGWSTLGTLDQFNVTDLKGSLHLQRATGSWDLNGIYKAVPSMPFTVTVRFTAYQSMVNFQQVGVMLGESSPGKLFLFGPLYANGSAIYSTTWSSRTSRSAYAVGTTNFDYRYMRLVVASSSDVTCQFSADGFTWLTQFANANPGFTVGSVGIGITTNDTGGNAEAYADWIRFGDHVSADSSTFILTPVPMAPDSAGKVLAYNTFR